jgi:CubicO group peptidase (beta-lactamase class C family)
MLNLLMVFGVVLTVPAAAAEPAGVVYPEQHWLQYATPEEAGWSSSQLDSCNALWQKIESAALMVIYDGAVLAAWGEVTRRYMCHSVRKSFLSALYGIHTGAGNIDLNKTLAELRIDDEPPLSTQEKTARIIHLLKARSGVYHPAAYETPGMKARRPARDSKLPGEFWYYNNWDFNALGTIFERSTGARVFEEFKVQLADPLGMEDFRLMDTYYHLEQQHSQHPAYPFKMSARDMARFGLLYLREGRWKSRQIIPRRWVEQTSTPYSEVPGGGGLGYGYMWWVLNNPEDQKHGMYLALGVGRQMIAVLPRYDLVIVNRTDTYYGRETDRHKLAELIDRIVEAKTADSRQDPELVPFQTAEHAEILAPPDIDLNKYQASFWLDREEVRVETIPYVIGDMIGHTIQFSLHNGRLLLTDNLGQKLVVLARPGGIFELEDARIPVRFEMDQQGMPVGIILDALPAWQVTGRRINSRDVN